MLSRFRARLTYANVIATVALFVALGGSSYAALKLPKASVGAKQLKKNSVTSPKVKAGSLLTSDFKASQRASLRGPQGPQGNQGSPGQPGAPGTARAYAAVNADNGQPAAFVGGLHPGFAAVSRTSTGVYCVTAPDLTLDQRNTAVVGVHNVGAAYFAAASVCTGGVEVWTRDQTGALVDFVDFNIVIP